MIIYKNYYIVVLLSSFFALLAQIFAQNKNEEFKLNKLFYFLSFCILFFYLGFRNFGIGIDDYTYDYIFQNVSNSNVLTYFINSGMEPGYLILNKIIGLFTKDFQVVICVCAFISLLFIYKGMVYERKHVNYFLSFFLFGTIVYPYFFGIIRLSLALSIIFYAYTFFFEKKYKYYTLFVLLASIFHYSSLVMLLLLILPKKELSTSLLRKAYLYLIVLLPFAFYLVSKIVVPLLNSRYSNYIISNSLSLNFGDIDKLLILILCYMFYDNLNKVTTNSKIYIFLYAISIILSICSMFISFGRTQWYFNILICILLPLIIKSIKKYGKYKYYSLIVIPLVIIYGFIYSIKMTDVNSKVVNFGNYDNILINNK